MNRDKFDPNSPKFNWNALAQKNEDTVKQTIRNARTYRNERENRIQERHRKSDRHQAAMYALDKKLRGAADKYSIRDIIRGEIGE
jgi:hypothetical protein